MCLGAGGQQQNQSGFGLNTISGAGGAPYGQGSSASLPPAPAQAATPLPTPRPDSAQGDYKVDISKPVVNPGSANPPAASSEKNLDEDTRDMKTGLPPAPINAAAESDRYKAKPGSVRAYSESVTQELAPRRKRKDQSLLD
jgi:hypothetical protein